MITPSVKDRMWALIIYPDSEGIDPWSWQSLYSWDGWKVAPAQYFKCTLKIFSTHTQ